MATFHVLNVKIRVRLQAFIFLLPALGFSQDRGSIRGTITDPSGAPIPAAAVVARNVDTGLTQAGLTSVDGVFNIPYLPVGNYALETTKEGFRKSNTSGLRMDVNSVVTVNVNLELGDVQQTVQVAATAPLLETNGSNLGKVLPTEAIRDLPLFISGGLRSNMNFIVLSPGVLGSASNPRISGGFTSGQSEQLDGAEAQSERRNDAAMQGVSVEAVEEFKVQTGAYSAEYGRTSDGVINWVTKSGTNQLHGSGFVFNRNEVFNARGFTFTPTRRPEVRQWDPGGSIGGPIYIPKVFDGRNKAFFFFAYERAWTYTGPTGAVTTVPLDAFRTGDLRGLVDSSGKQIPIYDPIDVNGNIIQDPTARPRMMCNGVVNVICPNRLSPVALANVALLPEPGNPNLIVNNTLSNVTSTAKSWVPSIKGDYIFTDKHRVSFLYSKFDSPATPNIGAVRGVPSSGWNTTTLINYARFSDDYTIKPNLLNHFTLGFNKRHYLENPGDLNFDSSCALVPSAGGPGCPAYISAVAIPGVVAPPQPGHAGAFNTSYVNFGNLVQTDSRQRTWNLKEQVAWVTGRHSIKFGFDYLKWLYRRIDCNYCEGQYLYASAATANPSQPGQSGSDWASFLLGLSSYATIDYHGDIAYYAPYYAWYVQDDFKASSKLTLNIGLRYDIPVPKAERHLYNSNFCPTCPNPGAGNLPGAMIFAGSGSNGSGITHFGETRLNGFGPRLGVAYQLNANTVIRAGSSIYYEGVREDGNADRGDQGFGGYFFTPQNGLGSGISLTTGAVGVKTPPGFLAYPSQVAVNIPITRSPTVQLFGTPFYFFPPTGRAPYFADWTLMIERSVNRNSVARVGYHATVGNKLLSRLTTFNQLDPKYLKIYGNLLGQSIGSLLSNPTTAATLNANGFKLPYTSCTSPLCPFPSYPTTLPLYQALEPFPQFAAVDTTAGGMNDGHMTFHALEASFEHRFSSGLYLLASYTFSKLIANSSAESGSADIPAQNTYNERAEKTVAAEDTPHTLRVSYVYELPFGKGKRWLSRMPGAVNAVFGNWKFSAIHTYYSGVPLGPFVCSQQMYGATGLTPLVGGAATQQSFGTRCSVVADAGSSIPLTNPAWSTSHSDAWRVPEINPAAFVYPNTGVYGNTPVRFSNLRGPWTVNEDMSLLKSFHVTEKKYFEFRASASNALNRVLLSTPDTNMNDSTFGKITQPQGNSPRQIQMGLKFYF
jgi:hypothetical protein